MVQHNNEIKIKIESKEYADTDIADQDENIEDQHDSSSSSSSSEEGDDYYHASYNEEDNEEDDDEEDDEVIAAKDPDHRHHQYQINLRVDAALERYQRNIQFVGRMTLPWKLFLFIRLCIQRDFFVWEPAVSLTNPLNRNPLYKQRRRRSFNETKRYLHSIFSHPLRNDILQYGEIDKDLDINHPICFYYHEKAVIANDLEWFRLLVEYGLDISQFDQISLMQLSMGIEQGIIELDEDYERRNCYLDDEPKSYPAFIELDFTASNTFSFYLIDILGINSYQTHSYLHLNEDANQNRRGKFSLPLYRYFLNATGYIPIQTKNYHSFNYLNAEELGKHEIFNFIQILIENDLYFNTSIRNPMPSSSSRLASIPFLERLNDEDSSMTSRYNHRKRKQEGSDSYIDLIALEQKRFFIHLIEESIWIAEKNQTSDIYYLSSYRERYLLLLLDHQLLVTMGYLQWRSLQETSIKVRRYSSGRMTRSQTSLESLEMEDEYFRTCPRSQLLMKAGRTEYQVFVKRLLNLSRDHQKIPMKMKEHQRYVNIAMMEVKFEMMLQYLVEEEQADVNYIERHSGKTILFKIYENFPFNGEVVYMMKYLYQIAGFKQIDQCVDDRTILQRAMLSDQTVFVDCLLHFGFGYRVESQTHFDPRERFININELCLENMHMNPLIFAAAHCYNMTDEREHFIVSHLIRYHKANVNARDWKGNTAVLYAVQNDCFELVRQLILGCNADIYLANNEEQSAYSLANTSLQEKMRRMAEWKNSRSLLY